MKKIPLYLAFFLIPLLAVAQNTTSPQGLDQQQNVDALGGNSNLVRTYDNRYQGVKNSPYFMEDWYIGDVVLENGARYEKVLLKLNTYADELVMRRKDKADSLVIDKKQVKRFTISLREEAESVFNFVKLKHKGAPEGEYFHEMVAGKYSLLGKYKKSILKADFQGGYSAGRYHDEYVPNTNYFVIGPDIPEPLKLKTSEKALLKQLNDKGSLAKFMKDTQPDLKTEKGLIAVIQHYNQ
jgi:hypothetical protein